MPRKFRPEGLLSLLHPLALGARPERSDSAITPLYAIKPSSHIFHITMQSKGRQQRQQSPPPGRGHSQHLGLLGLMPAGLMIDSTDLAALMKFTGDLILSAGLHIVSWVRAAEILAIGSILQALLQDHCQLSLGKQRRETGSLHVGVSGPFQT